MCVCVFYLVMVLTETEATWQHAAKNVPQTPGDGSVLDVKLGLGGMELVCWELCKQMTKIYTNLWLILLPPQSPIIQICSLKGL